MNPLNLDTPPPNHKFSISVEREETGAERGVRLFKDVALFCIALAFVSLMVLLCYRTLSSAATSADEKKWAMSVLSAATGGILGYLIRK